MILRDRQYYVGCAISCIIGSALYGFLSGSVASGFYYFIFWSILSPIVYAAEAKLEQKEQTKNITSVEKTEAPKESSENQGATITTKVQW